MHDNEPLWKTASRIVSLRRVGSYYRGRCPFHDDQRPSLLVGDDGFRCYACGERGGFVRWKQLTRDTPALAAVVRQGALIPKKAATLSYPDAWIGHPKAVKYFGRRGIGPLAVARFRLGYSGWRYAIPSYVDGRLLGVKLRIDPTNYLDHAPKYVSMPGSVAHLFNADVLHSADEVVICEGELDAITLWQLEIPAVTPTTGCTGFKIGWLRLFANKRVLLWLDNDGPGNTAQKALGMQLRWHGHQHNITVKEICKPEGCKDVGEWCMKKLALDGPGPRR